MKFACAAMLAVCGWTTTLHAQALTTPEHAISDAVKTESRIDVVFVLDTTGSMGGLIQGAKDKIWSIVNTMATAKPAPKIRLGLVGYRDRGDEYITKLTTLSDDLDAVYSDLMQFSAGGGGDGPESVNQGLNEAVTKFAWDESKSTLKLIYLVGDCPPHMDYSDDVKYQKSCEAAAKAGIIINTIQCGSDGSTTPIWQEIARSAEGSFFQIEQSGGVVAIATPFDEEITNLGVQMSATVIGYGTREQQAAQSLRQERSDDLAKAAPAAAACDRAIYNATASGLVNFIGEQELVKDVAEGKVKLAELKAEELPKELAEMPAEKRDEYVAAKAKQRAECQSKIDELSKKRQAFLDEHAKKNAGKGDGFDSAVLESLRAQAKRCGLVFESKK